MPGPGGGGNSGGGGRGPGPDAVNSVFNLSDLGLELMDTLKNLAHWAFSPIGDLIRRSEFVPDAVLNILPGWIENASIISCLIGSALFFVLIGIIVRWIRQAFLI